MTREEAIHRLKNTAWLGTNKDREETEQAVDMAIEALSERNIARDIATILENEQDMRVMLQNEAVSEDTQTERRVDHDRDWIIGCIEHDGFIKTDRFDKANQIILDALSAEAEWIGYNADKEDWLRTDGTPIFLVCDKCHGTVINNGSAHWNFCPNCGADMRGGAE